MTALIDADSLVYIISYNNKEHNDEQLVKDSCDSFLREILTMTGCDKYIGVFSDRFCFRHTLYKYAKYKGNRPEKPDFVKKWELIIKGYFTGKHGFTSAVDFEADDIVSAISYALPEEGFVICSPDKDLDQIPGYHYDYSVKKDHSTNTNWVKSINPDSALRNLFLQILMGDSGDNVVGIPGIGKKKAEEILDCTDEPLQWGTMVQAAYRKYFGEHYGVIIYRETRDTIMLLNPKHEKWDIDTYVQMLSIAANHTKTLDRSRGLFEV